MKSTKPLDTQLNFLMVTSTLKKISMFSLLMLCAIAAIQGISEALVNPLSLIALI